MLWLRELKAVMKAVQVLEVVVPPGMTKSRAESVYRGAQVKVVGT
jgi:hypothetical protein